jgi:hypothetical protein
MLDRRREFIGRGAGADRHLRLGEDSGRLAEQQSRTGGQGGAASTPGEAGIMATSSAMQRKAARPTLRSQTRTVMADSILSTRPHRPMPRMISNIVLIH